MKVNEISSKPCYIEIYCNNILIGTATGFQVHSLRKYLITNWHVVSGRNFITNECLSDTCAIPDKIIVTYKKFIADDNYEWTKTEIKLYDNEENPIWYEHPKYGHLVDVVAIPLETNSRYFTYKERFELETEYNLVVTEPIYVVGFPIGYVIKSKETPHAVWTSGTIASDPDLNVMINDKTLPAFLIDSRTRNGQSGSPVIYYSEEGKDLHCEDAIAWWGQPFMKEIGIYSGRLNKECDLGYVWKWGVIKEIIDSINTK